MATKCGNRHTLLRTTRRLAVLVFAIGAGFYVVFYFAQTPMVFQSERELSRTPADLGWDFRDITLEVKGETTHGWFIPHENPRGTVFFCHGNDGNIATRLGTARFLRSLGFSVLLYDYGGYGHSTGNPSESRVHADTAAMWSYLTETLRMPAHQIVIWGRSFGGGAASELGCHVTPAAIVLESTFSSMAEAAFKDYPWFPASLFLRHRFNNKKKVSQFTAPLLVIHSREDTLYPFEHGQELFERAPEPKQLFEIYGDHGEGPGLPPGVFEKELAVFLDPLVPPAETPDDRNPSHTKHGTPDPPLAEETAS